MKAAWYERRGSAREVLEVGDMPAPCPGDGEVRIRVSYSGISPGDVKKRSGWQGSPMPFPRVVPHSDGSGFIDALGGGVPADRIGQPVWCYGAQSYRAFGTAAEHVVLPASLAVPLPADTASRPELLEQAACLGIAGITGYRSVFADGPVTELTVLVWGASAGVGAVALQMARRGGARVLAIVRRPEQLRAVLEMGAHAAWLSDDPKLLASIKQVAPGGVHRVADVDFATHIDIDAAVIAVGGVICSYFSSTDRPSVPYWTLGFADVTLRLLGSDDFPASVKAVAASELTNALVEGKLHAPVSSRLPLANIATAHEQVEKGVGGRVILTL